MGRVKDMVQSGLRPLGVRLQSLSSFQRARQAQTEEWRQQIALVQASGARTVLDIGANVGQFAEMIHGLLPLASVHSFEPLPDCYREMVTHFNGQPWHHAYSMGLGDADGEMEMNRNEGSMTSSFLASTSILIDTFSIARTIATETVRVARLDDAMRAIEVVPPLLLKIDVQGYEDKVLAGGVHTLGRADLVLVEMSIDQLYQGQPLFDDVYRMLVNAGFRYRGNFDQLYSPDDGRIVQVDGLFTR